MPGADVRPDPAIRIVQGVHAGIAPVAIKAFVDHRRARAANGEKIGRGRERHVRAYALGARDGEAGSHNLIGRRFLSRGLRKIGGMSQIGLCRFDADDQMTDHLLHLHLPRRRPDRTFHPGA